MENMPGFWVIKVEECGTVLKVRQRAGRRRADYSPNTTVWWTEDRSCWLQCHQYSCSLASDGWTPLARRHPSPAEAASGQGHNRQLAESSRRTGVGARWTLHRAREMGKHGGGGHSISPPKRNCSFCQGSHLSHKRLFSSIFDSLETVWCATFPEGVI